MGLGSLLFPDGMAQWRPPPTPNLGQLKGTAKKPIYFDSWETDGHGAWGISSTPGQDIQLGMEEVADFHKTKGLMGMAT